MKEKIISSLQKQKEIGDHLWIRIQNISSSKELDDFQLEYDCWNKINSEILEKAYVRKLFHTTYNGIQYLGNVNDDNNSFQAKRKNVLYCLPRQIQHLTTTIEQTKGIRKIDLLPFYEELDFSDNNFLKSQNMKKIFISHSSKNENIIKPLIDLLENIGVHSNQIFFSSHPAYGVSLGEDIFVRLKSELEGNVFALFILSEKFYNSPVCLCEMGAIWIKSNKQIPILVPPFDFKDIKGVFSNSLGFKINDRSQLNSFKTEVETYFGLTPIHITRWEEKREEYLIKVNSLL